jgi:hypothetical protein
MNHHRAKFGETVVNCASPCIHVVVVLATAIALAGCADSRFAASNAAPAASAQASSDEPEYKTGYGSSKGYTTDVYTELFRSRKADEKRGEERTPTIVQNAPAIAPGPVPQSHSAPATASGPVQQVQPAPASGAKQEASAAEPSYPTAYGIPNDGPTTDLFTELFGPRRRDPSTQ